MGKLEQHRMEIDPVLSAIALGYTNGEYIADEVFPVVTHTKESGKAREFTKQLFEYHDAKRAIGADSNVITFEGKDPIPFTLEEYDLSTPLDYRELDEVEDINIETTRTYELSEMMKLRREKKVADLVQTSGNYTNTNTSAVSTKWDQSSSTPIKDITTAVNIARRNCGKRPNLLTLGATSFEALQNHKDFLDRLKTTDTAVVTPELIGQILKIPKVLVGDAVWIDPATGLQADVWLDNAILSYSSLGARDQRSFRTPGFGYTIVKKGWAPIDKYYGIGNKVQYVRYTTLEVQKFLGNIAGYLLRDTIT